MSVRLGVANGKKVVERLWMSRRILTLSTFLRTGGKGWRSGMVLEIARFWRAEFWYTARSVEASYLMKEKCGPTKASGEDNASGKRMRC